MFINRRMDKENVVHIYNEILMSNKKNKIMLFTGTWINLEVVTMSEVRHRKTNVI